ncbi:MAG TPA: hypothetical protein VLC30_10400 [Pseudomonas sp.]|nr:hypothetical protein [Pseudomonas sp.]
MSDIISQNPYAMPSSELQERAAPGQAPSIEEALNRGYDFAIGDLLGEAWNKTKGIKGIIWGGFLVFNAAMLVATLVLIFVMSLFGTLGALGLAGLGEDSDGSAVLAGALGAFLMAMVLMVALLALVYPFIAGINMVGIRQAAGQPVRFAEVFSHFGRTLPLLLAAILMGILVNIGFMLLIIPGIYLTVALLLTIPLIVERKLSAWQAITTSCKAINQHWFKVFFLYILLAIILTLSMIPFCIGLIWTFPMFIVAQGVLYRTIFGVLPAAN